MANDYSFESSVLQPIAEQNVETRGLFLLRTYLHLFGAILAFVGIEAMVIYFFGDAFISTLASNPQLCGLLLIGLCLGGPFVANMIIARSRTIAGHYAALGFYVLLEVAIFIPILSIAIKLVPNGPALVGQAAVMTGLIFGALTATVFALRKDFSFLRSALVFASIAAIGLILCSLLFGFSLGVVFTYLMIALACGYILYDTSNVMLHHDKSMYVLAACALFASIMLLFFYVLRLFLASRN